MRGRCAPQRGGDDRRTSDAMQFRRVTTALLLWFTLVTATFFVQWQFTGDAAHTPTAEVSLFGVTIFGDYGFDNATLSLGTLALWLVLSFLFCYVTARAIGRVCRAVVSPDRYLAVGSVFAVLLASVASLCWARSYWGYWISRSEAAAAWWKIDRVTSFARVTCRAGRGRWRCVAERPPPVGEILADCARDSYYCLEERLPVSLTHAGVDLLNVLPAPLTMRAVEHALATPRTVVRADAGYSGDRVLSGYIVSGTATEHRKQLLAVALAGPEIANDHHPMYEMLIDINTPSTRLVRRRTFFYDVAGIEGAEPPRVVLAAGIGALLIAVPSSLAAACLVAGFRRDRAHRPGSTA